MIDFELLSKDLDWISRAMQPEYRLAKGDNSNMFELSDDSEGYVLTIIEELERKRFKVRRAGKKFISLSD